VQSQRDLQVPLTDFAVLVDVQSIEQTAQLAVVGKEVVFVQVSLQLSESKRSLGSYLLEGEGETEMLPLC